MTIPWGALTIPAHTSSTQLEQTNSSQHEATTTRCQGTDFPYTPLPTSMGNTMTVHPYDTHIREIIPSLREKPPDRSRQRQAHAPGDTTWHTTVPSTVTSQATSPSGMLTPDAAQRAIAVRQSPGRPRQRNSSCCLAVTPPKTRATHNDRPMGRGCISVQTPQTYEAMLR